MSPDTLQDLSPDKIAWGIVGMLCAGLTLRWAAEAIIRRRRR